MSRYRLVAFFLITVLLLGAVPAAANSGPNDNGASEDFLALGDSVAFGFSPLVSDPSEPEVFVGYPESLAAMLQVDVVNASCPGEASGGFTSLSSPLDNGCRRFRFGTGTTPGFPLHVDYSTAQLDFAVTFLRQHRETRLVTINLGANDLFLLQRQCAAQPACIQAGLVPLLQTLGLNLGTIYARIRGEAGYRGQIIALTYYALDYADQPAVQAVLALNSVVVNATLLAGGQVADGFTAFAVASGAAGAPGKPCQAGLLIRLSPPTTPPVCDVHPTRTGHRVLANAIRSLVAQTGN